MWLLKAFDKIFHLENRLFENSLLAKILTDYNSSITPSTSNIIVRALNVSNCSTCVGNNSIQVET